eukprot:4953834-Pyramimonas_sp.AAC.1
MREISSSAGSLLPSEARSETFNACSGPETRAGTISPRQGEACLSPCGSVPGSFTHAFNVRGDAEKLAWRAPEGL